MGALHAGILSSLPRCKVVAAVDREERLVRIASKAVPNVCFHTEVNEMLSEHAPEIVYVCTPPQTHLAVTETLLASPLRPRAIFVEKPLAPTTEEAERMADLAQRYNTITSVGLQRRFLPTFQKAGWLIRDGTLGSLRLARAQFFAHSVRKEGEGWRFDPKSGGVTLELGVHLLDAMTSLLGRPEVVSARIARIVSKSCEDYVSAWLTFNDKLPASFEVGWSMWGFNPADFRVDIYGSEGGLSVTQDELTVFPRESDASAGRIARTFYEAELTPRLPILLGGPANVLIDMDFIQAVTSGSRPQVTFDTGVQMNRVIDAIRRIGGGT